MAVLGWPAGSATPHPRTRKQGPPDERHAPGQAAVMIIGVSLKMYFGYQQTLDWARRVRGLVTGRGSSPVELFVLPAFRGSMVITLSDLLALLGLGGLLAGVMLLLVPTTRPVPAP